VAPAPSATLLMPAWCPNRPLVRHGDGGPDRRALVHSR
jgi:hypothetical protein